MFSSTTVIHRFYSGSVRASGLPVDTVTQTGKKHTSVKQPPIKVLLPASGRLHDSLHSHAVATLTMPQNQPDHVLKGLGIYSMHNTCLASTRTWTQPLVLQNKRKKKCKGWAVSSVHPDKAPESAKGQRALLGNSLEKGQATRNYSSHGTVSKVGLVPHRKSGAAYENIDSRVAMQGKAACLRGNLVASAGGW